MIYRKGATGQINLTDRVGSPTASRALGINRLAVFSLHVAPRVSAWGAGERFSLVTVHDLAGPRAEDVQFLVMTGLRGFVTRLMFFG